MTEQAINKEQNNNTTTDVKEAESLLPTLDTSTATSDNKLSNADMQELLGWRKEMQKAKYIEEIYAPVGGEAGYAKLAASIEQSATVEQKTAINELLKKPETAKQAITLMQGLASTLNTAAAVQEEESPLPPLGSGIGVVETPDNKSVPKSAETVDELNIAVSDNITYNNVKDSQVKRALGRIEAGVQDFAEKNGHQNYDPTTLMHELAVKYLAPIVDSAERLKNKDQAREALLAYHGILKPFVESSIANGDPIPSRMLENSAQLVNDRNVENRMNGEGKLDYFEDMFQVDEKRQSAIDSLFSTKDAFKF